MLRAKKEKNEKQKRAAACDSSAILSGWSIEISALFRAVASFWSLEGQTTERTRERRERERSAQRKKAHPPPTPQNKSFVVVCLSERSLVKLRVV